MSILDWWMTIHMAPYVLDTKRSSTVAIIDYAAILTYINDRPLDKSAYITSWLKGVSKSCL